jgi:dTDP-4-dehydrorhamnose 3,5-epimerase
MKDGVKIKEINVIPNERDWPMEILRCDSNDIFERFSWIYCVTACPGVIKAWRYHKKQTDTIWKAGA